MTVIYRKYKHPRSRPSEQVFPLPWSPLSLFPQGYGCSEHYWKASLGISFRARFQATRVTPAHYFAIMGLLSPKVIPASSVFYLVHQTWLHLTLGSVQKSRPLSKNDGLPPLRTVRANCQGSKG